ncbi:hypothetical protein Pcinc_038413 [Petrolisthes cinctipes]|uniref:C2H2-type domain-containing protein n=1 Tax=Petrolisthes cinctipes TaxID=88211 RepID=A0AAE1EKE0_PETCI|nr:hypothetical protein Pcinc_038413 [Petrolisthes cinctipes]
MVRLDEAGGEELACPACGEEQASQHTLEQHVERQHPEYQVTCTSCQVAFKNYRALHLHNSMVHPTAASPPQIHLTQTDFSTSKFPLIAKEFCEASSRQYHHHDNTDSLISHRCQLCPATFTNADTWLMHVRDHTAASVPPLRCVNCDLTFPNLAQLAQHHQRHLCEEPQPRKESFLAVLDLLSKQTRDVSSAPVMDPSVLAGGLKPLLGPPPPRHLSPAPADSAKASRNTPQPVPPPLHPPPPPSHPSSPPPASSPMMNSLTAVTET